MASESEKRVNSSSTGTFTIHYFATASQYTSKNTERLPAPLPLPELYPLLEERYPGIREKVLSSCGVSLESEYVDIQEDADKVIQVGDEVAIIPPVSSG
jgi:molybdopterin converting factor small subunit